MVSIQKAEQIEGWMSSQELEWLANRATEHDIIVEIGCYRGRSTRALGDNARGFVITIDDFGGPRDVLNWSVDRHVKEENYSIFITNMKDLLNKSKVQLVMISFENMEKNPFFRELCPDFVFVDGNHGYDSVKRDISFWKPKMKKGGLLSGHDASHEPVARAVGELLQQGITTAPGTSIWFTTV